MIEIKNLVKTYGKVEAVKNVSFEVPKDSILGFLGPNGAGKSTTMNIITGYLAPTDGTVVVDGIDITENSIAVRKKIGYLPELPPLYGDMTVKEYLNFIADLKSVPQKGRKAMLDDVCYITKIGDHRGRLCKNLSKGYRQRVGFAQALVGDPPIIILDEPTVGLDPTQVTEFRKTISHLGRNHTIILCTHILQEVTAICSDVVIINNGTVARCGSLSEFTQSANGERRFVVTLDTDRETGEKVLNDIPGVKTAQFSRIDHGTSVYRIVADGKSEANRLIARKVYDAGIDLLELKCIEKSLEEEFVAITSGAENGGKI